MGFAWSTCAPMRRGRSVGMANTLRRRTPRPGGRGGPPGSLWTTISPGRGRAGSLSRRTGSGPRHGGRRAVAPHPSYSPGSLAVRRSAQPSCHGNAVAALSPEEVETALRAYEVMVILDPNLEERTVAPSLDNYL